MWCGPGQQAPPEEKLAEIKSRETEFHVSVPPNTWGCYRSLPIECQAQGVPLAASMDPASPHAPQNTKIKGSLFWEGYEEGGQRRKGKKIKG